MSPRHSLRPRASPAASVSAGVLVTSSSKVVIAARAQLKVSAVGADRADRSLLGHDPDRPEAGPDQLLLGTDAHELCLLAAGERILDRRSRRPGDLMGLDHTAATGHRGELLHLPDEPVRNVPAAQSSLVVEGAFGKLGVGKESAPL